MRNLFMESPPCTIAPKCPWHLPDPPLLQLPHSLPSPIIRKSVFHAPSSLVTLEPSQGVQPLAPPVLWLPPRHPPPRAPASPQLRVSVELLREFRTSLDLAALLVVLALQICPEVELLISTPSSIINISLPSTLFLPLESRFCRSRLLAVYKLIKDR